MAVAMRLLTGFLTLWVLRATTSPDSEGQWLETDLVHDEGRELKRLQHVTADDCKRECDSIDTCHSFSFTAGGHRCHLKDKCVSPNERSKHNDDYVTFYKLCSTLAPPLAPTPAAPTPAPAPPVFVPADKEELAYALYSWNRNAKNASCSFGDISQWNVSKVTDMSYMFGNKQPRYPYHRRRDPVFRNFNGDLSKWDVSGVTNMKFMFYDAFNFAGDLSNWDVSKVIDMSSMFHSAGNFNGDLSKWDVSKVIDMSSMFAMAENFNGDLSKWDVSKVTDMSYMFQGNTADYNSKFNGDLSQWDVSQVTSMSTMFEGACNFNGDLSKWDVSRVTDMKLMFHSAYNFNGDLSKWDVSKVQNADSMFSGTELYVQCLCDRLPLEFSVACHSSCTRYLAHTAPLVLV